MKTLFFGSGLFPLNIFKKLYEMKEIQSLSLATVPSIGFKEKNQIKDYAKKCQLSKLHILLDVYQPNKDEFQKFSEELRSLNLDIGLVCNYGYMIPEAIINCFSKGMFVIHPSLLPKFRGASPIQTALYKNETETGISFIEISNNKFDAGAILLQKSLAIDPNDRYKELAEKLALLGEQSVEEFIQNLQILPRIQQGVASKAPKLSPKHLIIDFDGNVEECYNRYRSVYGTNFNSLKLQFEGRYLYIEKANIANDEEQMALSNIQSQNGGIIILKENRWKKNIYIKFNQGWLKLEQFRYLDRGLVQSAHTFKDQYLKEYVNGSKLFTN